MQARRNVSSNEEVVFFAASVATLPESTQVLLELRFTNAGVRVVCKSQRPELAPFAFESLRIVGGL